MNVNSIDNIVDLQSNQEGGKYVGKGSHGCVFSPNMKCDASDTISDNYISKLIRNTDEKISEEYDSIEAFKLNIIDPDNALFLYPIKRCDIKQEFIDSEYQKCSFFKKMPLSKISEKFINIIQPYGGKDLSYIQNNIAQLNINEEPDKLILDFLNLFIAIAVLEKNKIVHRDLKPANITHNERNSMKIIDFGLSAKYIDNLFDKAQSESGNWDWAGTDYYYWPKDLQLVYGDKMGGKYDRNEDKVRGKDNAEAIDVLTREANNEKTDTYSGHSWQLNDNHHNKMFESLLDFMVDLHIKKILDDKEHKKIIGFHIQSKWDVFGLGAALSEFIKTSNWKSSNSDFNKDFENLLIEMTSLHPVKRIIIHDALETYLNLLAEYGNDMDIFVNYEEQLNKLIKIMKDKLDMEIEFA
jgi:serine/threonine protein kinase